MRAINELKRKKRRKKEKKRPKIGEEKDMHLAKTLFFN
jgi:hypothetical protein